MIQYSLTKLTSITTGFLLKKAKKRNPKELRKETILD